MAYFLIATGERFRDGKFVDTVKMDTRQHDPDFACIVFRQKFDALPDQWGNSKYTISNISLRAYKRRGFK